MIIQTVNGSDWYHTVVDKDEKRVFFGTKEQCVDYIQGRIDG